MGPYQPSEHDTSSTPEQPIRVIITPTTIHWVTLHDVEGVLYFSISSQALVAIGGSALFSCLSIAIGSTSIPLPAIGLALVIIGLAAFAYGIGKKWTHLRKNSISQRFGGPAAAPYVF